MKKIYLPLFISGFLAVAICCLFSQDSFSPVKIKTGTFAQKEQQKMAKNGFLTMQSGYQFMKLKNPKTGMIPPGIRSRELAFAAKLPAHSKGAGQSWNWRGPANIGGRMLCIAVDVDNDNHILAGSASGGMWESNIGGKIWHKTTSPDAEQSATCLVQDRRPGKHNIWYYGTGEMLSTTDRNISTNARTVGIGNGIYKSTDNGASWQPLPSTQVSSPANLLEIFQGVWRIVTDPVRTDKDIVYAACYGAIMRSEDGGVSWHVTLGDLVNKSFCSDLAISSDGVLYAALSSFGFSVEPPGKAGIWRSTDGLNWTKITPSGFPADNRVTKLALAPSNEKVMYVFTESQSPNLNPFNGYTNSVNTFWKMTWNPAANSAIWENRTSGMPGRGDGDINDFPFALVVYGGYCVGLGVKPDDENVVFLGGMNMYRSNNGFADSLMTTYVGGYPYDMDSIHQLHPDQHGITFLNDDPSTMFAANDGGICITHDCMADSSHFTWERRNKMLTTTQFYSIAIDHGSMGDDWILGGLQDNNWYYTITDNPLEFWFNIDICYDGFATCIAHNWEYCVISAYSGNIWTSRFDNNMHTKDIFPQLPDTLLKYYDPVMGSNALFPFYQNMALDPVTNQIFYLPTVTSIWRKDNLKAAAYDSSLRNVGWSHLSNVDVGAASEISSLSISVFPPNRIYYGTNLGKVFRLDNANTGNPTPVEITGASFPVNAFVAYIDIDPDNADRVMVTFSNYGVQSLFHSENGGSTWTSVGGNLEENPDGSGSGPSIRCTKKLFFQGKKIIFAGTSCGLFSTRELKGDSTVWVKEGATTLGNVIVDDIDARQTDGFIAIGTHGNGVYSAYFDPSAGIRETAESGSFNAGNVFPNPVRNVASLKIHTVKSIHLNAKVYTAEGKPAKAFPAQSLSAGDPVLSFSFEGLSSGVYFLALTDGIETVVRKVIKSDGI
ncbi:MAG: T9SS type A sorting domain-containing protein [Bacteroidetes bacterium]|nr:T9SS type A sorting domain-containing protein [Bacteroidota bacterium]